MNSLVIYQIFMGIYRFLSALEILLIVYALMTWFVRPDNQLFQFLRRFLDPIVSPFRRLNERLMRRGLMLDLSIVMAVIAIRVLQRLLLRLAYLF